MLQAKRKLISRYPEVENFASLWPMTQKIRGDQDFVKVREGRFMNTLWHKALHETWQITAVIVMQVDQERPSRPWNCIKTSVSERWWDQRGRKWLVRRGLTFERVFRPVPG